MESQHELNYPPCETPVRLHNLTNIHSLTSSTPPQERLQGGATGMVLALCTWQAYEPWAIDPRHRGNRAMASEQSTNLARRLLDSHPPSTDAGRLRWGPCARGGGRTLSPRHASGIPRAGGYISWGAPNRTYRLQIGRPESIIAFRSFTQHMSGRTCTKGGGGAPHQNITLLTADCKCK